MFINCSQLLTYNVPQYHYGIAVTDIDHDGDFELFVAGYGVANRVLKWHGTHFIDIAGPVLADAEGYALGIAAGDVDGDGHEEIYVLNSDTFSGKKRIPDRLFAHDLGSNWVDLFELRHNQPALNLSAGRSVACVDRYGNGRYGMFLANYGGPMRLIEQDDDGWLQDVARAAGVAQTTGGRGVVAFPIVSDHVDIFAGNELGPNFLFRNRGDGTFEDVASRYGMQDSNQHMRGVSPVNLDGQGRLGLAWGNWEGPHRLFTPNHGGPWEDVAPPEMAQPSRVRTVIAADFDNDGVQEVFFNNMGEPNRLFAYRQGRWQAIEIGAAAEPDGYGTGAVVGDFDHDGRLELLISHGENSPQPLSYYRPALTDNHWLRVLPQTQHGAPARGAVVSLHAGGHIQRRVIDGGSGYLCQMEPVAHFGLGAVQRIASIEVKFPDGRVVTRHSVDANRTLVITHPTAAHL